MKNLLAAGVLSYCLFPLSALAAEGDCADWAAEADSVQGLIEVRRADQDGWSPVARGDLICHHDSVRSDEFARASFRIPDDTFVYIGDGAALTFLPPEDDSRTLLDLLKGIILIISRDSRALTIGTPYLNAGLEGTEFQLRVEGDQFDIAVYEGEVVLAGDGAEAVVSDLEALTSMSGDVSESVRPVEDRTELLWALHYPLILDGVLPVPGQAAPAAGAGAMFYAGRAQARLSVGQIDPAREDIRTATGIVADFAPALALDAMIALSQDDLASADALLQRALDQNPDSATALIAKSHLLIRRNELRAALEAAERAVEAEPDNAIAHARLAVALVSVKAVREAFAAIEDSLALNPSLAEAYATRGFALMADGSFAEARNAFSEAIPIDSAAPLPRIGLAIAHARSGEIEGSRDQLEAAVILDANDSVVRSYMGKAYADELRDTLAGEQLDIASSLDADDRTPLVYNAAVLQAANRPVEALASLDAAASANNNRAAFRSALYLDEDLVTRQGNANSVYRTLGFEGLALVGASHAVAVDPSDHSAHRQLADSYAIVPRGEITRANEAFQARMLQPINVLPELPQLSLPNMFIADSVGPAALAHNEARRGFTQNGLDVHISAIGASNGTQGNNLVFSYLTDRVSLNAGQFHFETDGFHDNNEFEHDVLSVSVQGRLSSETSLHGELRSVRINRGDLRVLFDPSYYAEPNRALDESDLVRFGVTHRLGPWGQIVSSVELESLGHQGGVGTSLSVDSSRDSATIDFAYLRDFPRWTLVTGARVDREDREEAFSVSATVPFPPFEIESTEFVVTRPRHLRAYSYANYRLTDGLQLTAGMSFDSLDVDPFVTSETNPKLGLIWRPSGDTYLRVALYQTVIGIGTSKQLLRPTLEPTQVAGFGQYLFGSEGELARNLAVGFDHRLAANLRLGLQHTERTVEVPFFRIEPPSPELILDFFDIRESMNEANLYWTPMPRLAMRFGWLNEEFDYKDMVSQFGFTQLEMERIPVEATVFVGRSLSFRLTATNVEQRGNFFSFGPGFPIYEGESKFNVLDAAVEIRLPNRRGTIEVGVKNLLDEEFQFQDTDPENPRIFPERFLMTRFSLAF